MRIDAGQFSFSPPPGLDDISGYYFIAREGPGRIEVSGGFLSHGVSDLDGMVGDRRSEIPVPMESQAMATLDGVPARTLSFTAPGLVALRGRLAIALDPAPSEGLRYVQIAFLARADDDGEAACFAHVVASASFAGAVEPAQPPAPPEGWVRRYAGRLWLDVPESLPPPRTYVFRSPDEAMRFEVAVVDASDEPGIEEELAFDLSLGGTLKDRTRTDIARGRLTGTLHAYTITRAEDGVLHDDVVRRAHLLLRDVPVAHVSGRAPSIDAPALEAALDTLLGSIEETERR
jgi:hypothetical protein